MLFWTPLLCLAVASCEKDDDDAKEEESDSEAVDLVRVSEVTLHNQYSEQERFYDVLSGEVHADTAKPFTFMFLYPEGINSWDMSNNKVRYMLASSSSKELQKEMLEDGKLYRRSEGDPVKFYKLPSSFRNMMFDTLSTVSALKSILDKSQIYFNEGSRSDCLYSDGFGWSAGDIFAFKASGKCGIMRVKTISPYIHREVGYMVLEVKFEGE